MERTVTRVEGLELGGWKAAERLVQALGVVPGEHSTIASSSGDLLCQTRSAISSVLKVSTQLWAIALSNASPTDPRLDDLTDPQTGEVTPVIVLSDNGACYGAPGSPRT